MRTLIALVLLALAASAAGGPVKIQPKQPTLQPDPDPPPAQPANPPRRKVVGQYEVVTGDAEGDGNYGGACLLAQPGRPFTCRSHSDCEQPIGSGWVNSDEAFCVSASNRPGQGVRGTGPIVRGSCWYRPAPGLLRPGQPVCSKGNPMTKGFVGTMSAPPYAFGPMAHKWRVISCQSLKNVPNPQTGTGEVPACRGGPAAASLRVNAFGDVLSVPSP